MPLLLIIAGCNGAGRTTFARPYTAARELPFLNADDLTLDYRERAGLSEDAALVRAGRTFLAAIDEQIGRGVDFAFETTLSGGYINGVVGRAKAAGYRVELVYLFVDSAQVAVARVAQRVRKGGHDVPEEAIRRRYERSRGNFLKLRNRVDGWRMYYSAGGDITLIAERNGASLVILDTEKHDDFVDG